MVGTKFTGFGVRRLPITETCRVYISCQGSGTFQDNLSRRDRITVGKKVVFVD